ncbi:GNAT family N-acetyltransferase [Stutzerimonas balearica]|uniref:GNAT family N-acetyltransferase n=1 Tax=Stutzerimonas balearica TaxID=74829 RepID=UPI00289912A1|nr:GNAT family N-acetyltransferase [Stutzerimonas balearica]
MNIRLAQLGDVKALCSLAYSSFDTQYIKKMIYGCFGMHRYLEMCLSQEDETSETVIYVCEIDGELCGFVHLKREAFSGTLYLNYICVDSSFRGKNIASTLLLFALLQESSGFEQIALDVFSTNMFALRWYEKLGFCEVKKKYWLICDIEDAGSGYGYISGFAHAKLSQDVFGFSQFGLGTKSGVYNIGMLDNFYYRIFDRSILLDKAALSTLAKLDPRRRLLLIADRPDCELSGEYFDTSFNMSARLSIVLEKLKGNSCWVS